MVIPWMGDNKTEHHYQDCNILILLLFVYFAWLIPVYDPNFYYQIIEVDKSCLHNLQLIFPVKISMENVEK